MAAPVEPAAEALAALAAQPAHPAQPAEVSLLRRSSNVRYINPLCEVFAGAKWRCVDQAPALSAVAGNSTCTYITRRILSTRKKKPFEPLRRREC